jgi:HTH-type transcriptional regulator / antitoxin HipB
VVPAVKSTTTYDARDIGLVVRELRRERSWTQADLASWLGVSRPTIVKLEAGGNVSLRLALKALAILGATATVSVRATGIQDDGNEAAQ